MNDSYIYNKCCELNWDIVRKFLLDPTINDDKKLRCILYQNGSTCGWSCLHEVCYTGAPADIIKLFIDIGGKQLVMMTTEISENTALHFACSMGVSFDVMKTLIDVGGKDLVMAKNHHGCNALHYLCYYINKHHNAAKKIKRIGFWQTEAMRALAKVFDQLAQHLSTRKPTSIRLHFQSRSFP